MRDETVEVFYAKEDPPPNANRGKKAATLQ